MSQHVFSWLAGFGWTIVPQAPFRLYHVPDEPKKVLVEYDCQGVLKSAEFSVNDRANTLDSKLGINTDSVNEVADIVHGRAYEEWPEVIYDSWHIETAIFATEWPDGFFVQSRPKRPVFDFHGPDGSMIWIQGPLMEEKVPPIDKMVGPGQSVTEIGQWKGGPYIELRYTHDDREWCQFHCRIEFMEGTGHMCAVTSQGLAEHVNILKSATQTVADSFKLCE